MTLGRLSIFAVTVALGLVACSSQETSALFDGAKPTTFAHVAKSWMSPAAKSNKLLYVSDSATNEVYVYTYPGLSLAGILTGFSSPHGLCVNAKSGEVYVVNTGASNIVVYAHGELLPEYAIKDNGQQPLGCSVSPNGRTLAVSNLQTSSAGPGSVTVFNGSNGVNYPVGTMETVGYVSYDSSNNIFVDGADASGNFQFAELVKGKSTFKSITLDQSIGRAGGVESYGKYVVVGDETTNTIYLVVHNQVVGSTVLSGASEVVQFFISSATLIGPDDGNASIGLWKYPQGGSPIQLITGSYLSKPTAAVLSS